MKNEACGISRDDVKSIAKILLVHLYNLLWLLMYMSMYKLTLSTCALNPTALVSGSFILKIIFQNTPFCMLLQAKKPLKLRIISASTFAILRRLEFFNATMVKSLKVPS